MNSPTLEPLDLSRPDPVIDAYSRRAELYDQEPNLRSCWGRLSDQLAARLTFRPDDHLVVDVGCGTGRTLQSLAAGHPARFVGIEPAPPMRDRAASRLAARPNVRLLDGRFEHLPLPDQSVDYLYSLLAFHWTQDAPRSVAELRRVLRPGGRMDLFFPGRLTGREFTAVTMPIFLRRFGLAWVRAAAARRQHLTLESARRLFAGTFPGARVEETLDAHHDDLDGHWSWWQARAVAHLPDIPPGLRAACDEDLRRALGTLATPRGIPYTLHLLHVRADLSPVSD